MIKRNALIILLIFSPFIFAQKIGSWNIYTDMKNVIQSAVVSEGLWAVTQGGAFYFNFSDNSYLQLTKSSGLSSHILTSVAIDDEGKTWFGTQEGIINVYNPSTNTIKKILDIYNSDKSQKKINSLTISGDTVFVSTDFGLSLINSGSYEFIETTVKFGDFPTESTVNSIYKNSRIYACTSKGVAISNIGANNLSAPESWTSYTVNANTTYKIVNLNGSLILATDRGLFQFDGNNWNSFLFSGTDIKDIAIDNNILFILLKNNLYRYENSITYLTYSDWVRDFSKFEIENNVFYISSNKGVIKYTNGNVELIFPNSPQSNSFQSITVDNEGIVWAGSGRDETGVGIFKYDGISWTTYDVQSNPELLSNAYHTVYSAPDNTKYFANWGNGFAHYVNGTFEIFNTHNTDLVGIPSDPNFLVVRDLIVDSQNNIWILNFQSANRKPLSVLTTNGTWYHYEFDNPAITENMIIEHLLIDQYDTKWFAVTIGNRGLYYFNENHTLNNPADDTYEFISSSEFTSDMITALALDLRGAIWVGTNKGVNIIQNPAQPTTQMSSSFPLVQQTINAIVVDPLDRKWVGTNQGLFLMSSDGVRILEHYDTQNSPLPSDQIKSLAFDQNNGIIYIGSDYGLTSLSTEAVQPLDSFSELFVYPNPFVIGQNNTVQLTIDGLIRNSEIKIFSIDGNLIDAFQTPGGRMASWDGKDSNGNFVASGVYIIVAYDDEANDVAKTKVAVLRR